MTMRSYCETNSLHHNRSTSFPCRSHPSTIRIEEELNKLKTLDASSIPTARNISSILLGLQTLHECLNDLFKLPLTYQALSKYEHEKWADKLLEESLRLLDIIGSTVDAVSQFNEHVKNLQSALRRRKGDLSTETNITKYFSIRKKMNKDVKKFIASLKQMDCEIRSLILLDPDHSLFAEMTVIREVSITSISSFQYVLSYFSVPSKSKSIRWSFSKLMNKQSITSEDQKNGMNELGSLDMALCALSRHDSNVVEKLLLAGYMLKILEADIGGIEKGLECMFRSLIRSRTSILNIISC